MGKTNVVVNNYNGNTSAFLRKFKLYKAKIVFPDYIPVSEGPLIVGGFYTTGNSIAGDDFRNVGGILMTGEDSDYVSFIATGTTPAVWTNGSLLQYWTPITATILENDLGGNVEFKFRLDTLTQGILLQSDGLFTLGKTIVKGDASGAVEVMDEPTDPNVINIQGVSWRGQFGNYIEIEVYP